MVIQQCRFVTFCPTSLSRELFIKCQATNKKNSCSQKTPENCNSSLLVLFLLFVIESLTRKEIIERSASQAKLCWVLRFLEFLKIVWNSILRNVKTWGSDCLDVFIRLHPLCASDYSIIADSSTPLQNSKHNCRIFFTKKKTY